MTDQTTNPPTIADIAASMIVPIGDEKKVAASKEDAQVSTDTGPGGEADAVASDHDVEGSAAASAENRDGDGAGEKSETIPDADPHIDADDGQGEGADPHDLLTSPDQDDDVPIQSDSQAVDDDDPYAMFDTPETEGETTTVAATSDDQMISVTVDGDEQSVPLGELKRRYSGEGAIEKRLQEATELRNADLQAGQKNREQWTQLYGMLSQELFKPTIPKPEASLYATDPTRFEALAKLHNDEEQAIQMKRQQIGSAMEHMKKQEDDAKLKYRTDQAARLREVLPILSHPQRGTEVQRAIVNNAIATYGYSAQDVAEASDSRLFHMAHDAMMWRQSQSKGKIRKAKTVERTTRAAAKATKPTITRSQNATKLAKARKTGEMDDIAASMVVSKKSNRRLSAQTR